MHSGIGRNDPCWCGSGKKYKRCHLDRDKQQPQPLWEVDQGLRSKYEAKRCMVPTSLKQFCSGNIVFAHTVPKSGSLNKIASSGHVYAFLPGHGLHYLEKSQGLLVPKLVGVNRASTFTGFCASHDKHVFAPVEDAPITFTQQQCFLLAYRALAREAFLKQAELESTEFLKTADKGLPFAGQLAIQQFAHDFHLGVSRGATDLARHKAKYDQILESGDFSSVRSYVVLFDRFPSVMCSSCLYPYESFDATPAQDFANFDLPAQAIFFTSFAANDRGAVVFTWLPDSDPACKHFIGTLRSISDRDLTCALIRFFFEYCENVQINPEWWDNLDEAVQRALLIRINNAVNPLAERPMDCLLDDGVFLADWGVRERFTVGA